MFYGNFQKKKLSEYCKVWLNALPWNCWGAYSTTPRLPTAFCAMHMFYAHIISAPSAFFFLYYPLTSWISTKGGLTYKKGVWHPLSTMGNKDLVWGVYWGTFPGGGGVRIFGQWRSDSPHFPCCPPPLTLQHPMTSHLPGGRIPWTFICFYMLKIFFTNVLV